MAKSPSKLPGRSASDTSAAVNDQRRFAPSITLRSHLPRPTSIADRPRTAGERTTIGKAQHRRTHDDSYQTLPSPLSVRSSYRLPGLGLASAAITALILSAIATSSSVISEPAEWVHSAKVTVRQRISMSGW